MSPLKVVADDGGVRWSKGKVSGVVLMALGAYTTLVPFINMLTKWHLPTPAGDAPDLVVNAIDSIQAMLSGIGVAAAGMGLHSIRSNQ